MTLVKVFDYKGHVVACYEVATVAPALSAGEPPARRRSYRVTIDSRDVTRQIRAHHPQRLWEESARSLVDGWAEIDADDTLDGGA